MKISFLICKWNPLNKSNTSSGYSEYWVLNFLEFVETRPCHQLLAVLTHSFGIPGTRTLHDPRGFLSNTAVQRQRASPGWVVAHLRALSHVTILSCFPDLLLCLMEYKRRFLMKCYKIEKLFIHTYWRYLSQFGMLRIISKSFSNQKTRTS